MKGRVWCFDSTKRMLSARLLVLKDLGRSCLVFKGSGATGLTPQRALRGSPEPSPTAPLESRLLLLLLAHARPEGVEGSGV